VKERKAKKRTRRG